MSNFILLENIEKEVVLRHIKETLDVMSYPTFITFSSIARLAIVGFLRGRGDVEDSNLEVVAVDVFRQLSEYASVRPTYKWFDDWSWKMVKSSKERRVRTG